MKNGKNQSEPKNTSESFKAKEYFEQYWRYSAAVRNWFVAFGIGCCVLLMSENAGFKEVSKENKANIVRCLLAGVICQILLALLNKYVHWCVYWGKENKEFGKSEIYQKAWRISTWFWIDVVADLLTVIVFGIAIHQMFNC